MPDLTIAEAASALGVSVDTVRRRIKAGEITARRDPRGHYVVSLPGEEGTRTDGTAHGSAQQPPWHTYAGDTEHQLLHTQELLAEVQHQRDQLERQVESQREQIDRAEVERAELRRLLGNAQQQVQALLPAPKEERDDQAAPSETEPRRRPMWRRWPWPRRV